MDRFRGPGDLVGGHFRDSMKLTDIAGCVGGSLLFLLASMVIPFIGPFFSLLIPLPFLFYSTRLGLFQGMKLAVLAVLAICLVAELAGLRQMILLGVEFSLFGLFLSELFRKNLPIGRVMVFATGFMLALGAICLLVIALSKGMGPLEMIRSYMREHLRASLEIYREMGVPREKTLELESFGKAFTGTILRIYPSLVIIGTGFTAWLNVVIARPLFRAGRLPYPENLVMDRWQAPEPLVWVLIGSGFALFLPSGGITLLALNALIVLMTVYLFQGMSILLFFLNKFHAPRWARFGIYALVMIQQLFLVVLALSGLFDQWIDFRKIHRKDAAGG